ncbi:MAG TPA: hypothetical protein ENJ85_03330 [Oceanithermus profundus]|uniref:Uncharacterized protein n=1 Tax=Oceanithermus profundus TaxID=187137 RepID=A0A7C5SSH3_9DEIN|nr:hypothetical protein [Oceanithermus profundus]
MPTWARKRRRVAGEENPTDRNYGDASRLRGAERQLFDRLYSAAMGAYDNPKFAEGCGWRGVRVQRGRDVGAWGSSEPLPPPGDTVVLGYLIEFAYVAPGPDGELALYRSLFKPGTEPELLWSRKNKMLVAFPQTRMPAMRNPLTPKQRALETEYRRWAQRAPRGSATIRVPRTDVALEGAADTVVYRSSKWTKVDGDPPGSQEYIHQFGEKVGVHTSPGEPPSAIMFRGGKLDVLPAGIVN